MKTSEQIEISEAARECARREMLSNPMETLGEHVQQLLNAETEKLHKELYDACELHTMQLAAIMTASFQNTESTIKDRIGRDHPYCSQAYLDVCVAIDREMKLRKENEELKDKLAVQIDCYKALKYLHRNCEVSAGKTIHYPCTPSS